jgi:hypothetical protein
LLDFKYTIINIITLTRTSIRVFDARHFHVLIDCHYFQSGTGDKEQAADNGEHPEKRWEKKRQGRKKASLKAGR